ncbi:hypothetical protein Bcav_1791 [Beutenbergia cavernae DSM 12333]|uniref:Uncharacterized protein n=1 Tax=Beutenbergia cavernae (strain ATCC BAA-8 / DSM 12333 / CCUG 43141 / JCM 11478 / NBRC 16432 / NCIMB 13614 / HKI 0122) TaxID=471853 RepID=C5C4R9_BEUC1|nr:hypothetical protein [Beutenbergia cavernae]ACQ80047.1 hypothetical protein Bcav_1791 [Beutenbergia cavernae DSM 12333]
MNVVLPVVFALMGISMIIFRERLADLAWRRRPSEAWRRYNLVAAPIVGVLMIAVAVWVFIDWSR